MTDLKYTLGPWRIATNGNFGNVVQAQSGRRSYEGDDGYRHVASFQPCGNTDHHDEQEENGAANGRLIAAAPELLEVLLDVAVLGHGRCVIGKPLSDKIRAILDKAILGKATS